MTRQDYLQSLQHSWNTYGKEDPLWAICVDPAKQNNRWDIDEFFALGRTSVDGLMHWCGQHGMPRRRATCLDFGCGVGRLTQALAEHFTRAVGVDIAPSMVEQARSYNRHGKRCEYVVNAEDGLPLFRAGTFDLIYTEYVLQHMHPALSRRYVAEFIRVLRPGGLACFQLPERLPRFDYPQGMAARITADRDSLVLQAGGTSIIKVTVTNTGNGAWRSEGSPRLPMRVCHHWYDVNSRAALMAHGHKTIAPTVAPGETVTIAYPVTAPDKPGHYFCLIDLMGFDGVHFSLRGNTPASLEAAVTPPPKTAKHSEGTAPAASDASATASGPRPAMEMHAVPVKDMATLIKRAGGILADCERTGGSPDELGHARYYVTK